jgi:Zn-dependent alcohol dehydrogenase
VSGGVKIKVTMTGGYSIQASSNNSFALNTGSGLTLSLSAFSTTEFGSTTASMNAKVNDGAGKFTWGITQFNIPNGKTSVRGFTATILGVSTGDLTANKNGNVVSVHYCTPVNGALSLNCSKTTAFASSSPIPSVPEPGTLTMLGTGLIGLAGLARRRLIG